MITSSHPNLIESDAGFRIRVRGGGHLGILYEEGSRKILVLSAPAIDPVGYVVYEATIKEWLCPGSGQIITDEERERIVKNLRDGFAVQGYKIKVDCTTAFRSELLLKLQRLPPSDA